jgi:hypothetical protein
MYSIAGDKARPFKTRQRAGSFLYMYSLSYEVVCAEVEDESDLGAILGDILHRGARTSDQGPSSWRVHSLAAPRVQHAV